MLSIFVYGAGVFRACLILLNVYINVEESAIFYLLEASYGSHPRYSGMDYIN